MQTEIEAKFLAVDHNMLRAKLRERGALLVEPMRLMRRRNYNIPGKPQSWARVRDEGSVVTMSYKQLDDRTLHGTREVSLIVNDFAAAQAFLEAIGLEPSSYQETRRESWRLNDVEIELDQWPWIKPYIEVEGPSESAVRRAAAQLNLDWDTAKHGSVEVAYRAEYNVTDEEVCAIKEIRFEEPMPEVLAERRRP